VRSCRDNDIIEDDDFHNSNSGGGDDDGDGDGEKVDPFLFICRIVPTKYILCKYCASGDTHTLSLK
jgi:hypothetical protein